MTCIAHLTDIHFGAVNPEVVSALTRGILEYPPDLVVVSGDLTQGARRTEFRAARAFLDGFGVPTIAVPGNHDITPYLLWERFTDPYRRWREEIAQETQPVWRDDTVAVFGLNTARRAGFHPDWSRGRVTRARLNNLLTHLDATPRHLIRVVTAHHPLLPPETLPLTSVVGGATRALRALAAHDVRLVLAGHLHRAYARMDSVQTPRTVLLQGGSAISTRLRGEPNEYNRITVHSDSSLRIARQSWNGHEWTQSDVTDIPPPADCVAPAPKPHDAGAPTSLAG